MPRKSIGETAMTDAERQARYRAARAAGRPASACDARSIIAVGPGGGTTTSLASWKHRLSSRSGWIAYRTTFRTVRPLKHRGRSAIST